MILICGGEDRAEEGATGLRNGHVCPVQVHGPPVRVVLEPSLPHQAYTAEYVQAYTTGHVHVCIAERMDQC